MNISLKIYIGMWKSVLLEGQVSVCPQTIARQMYYE